MQLFYMPVAYQSFYISTNWLCVQVAAEDVQVLNAVRLKLPFLVTTADDAKDSAKEEIRLR